MSTIGKEAGKLRLADIDAIERGCEGVTPGPWHTKPTGDGLADTYVMAPRPGSKAGEAPICIVAPQCDDENVRYIARLDPNTVKALCALARAALSRAKGEA